MTKKTRQEKEIEDFLASTRRVVEQAKKNPRTVRAVKPRKKRR